MTREQIEYRVRAQDPHAQITVRDLTGTQDHWEIEVISSKFEGLTRMDQHKMILGYFSAELKTGEVHALSIKTKPQGPSAQNKTQINK